MSKRLGVVAMMLLLIASSAIVSASEQESAVSNGGYIVLPGVFDTHKEPLGIKSVYATITQSVTNWHTKSVSSFLTSLNVDLNWGTPSNSLRLKVYSPDGYTFGPYYDSYDGTNNGRTNLDIINNNGLAQGTWHYEVYGYSVAGTQGYYI